MSRKKKLQNGILYVVAVPIGNYRDISLRAQDIFREVEGILCEDTRRAGRLLAELEIKTHLVSFHAHNQKQKSVTALEKLRQGESWALVSDSGTPAISDPGSYLVDLCHQEGIAVRPIPGASAAPLLFSASGFLPKATLFLGFLSPKKGKRKKQLQMWHDKNLHLLIYESPYRIMALLEDIVEIFEDPRIFIGREMTKTHEEYLRGSASELLAHFKEITPKGEFALLVELGKRAK